MCIGYKRPERDFTLKGCQLGAFMGSGFGDLTVKNNNHYGLHERHYRRHHEKGCKVHEADKL